MINTILRNNYKTFNIIGNSNDYLEKTFIKLGKAKKSIDKYYFLVLYDEIILIDNTRKIIDKLNTNGMIIILYTKKKNIKIIKHLKENNFLNIMYEESKKQNGMIFIVKKS